MRSHCHEAPLIYAAQLGACAWSEVSDGINLFQETAVVSVVRNQIDCG